MVSYSDEKVATMVSLEWVNQQGRPKAFPDRYLQGWEIQDTLAKKKVQPEETVAVAAVGDSALQIDVLTSWPAEEHACL